jgi:3-demethoxyubiquinol 3-hydroxylase
MLCMPAHDLLDSVLRVADETLRTLFAPARSSRPLQLPADTPMSDPEKRHIAGLMRVNHAGEVAAQGLYRGHALFARSPATRDFLQRTAREEGDHLAWCEDRLAELGSHPSRLNPVWYLGSFLIGAATSALGDELSLGFVNETEAQVEGHLAGHLERLPVADARSRQILEQMKADEAGHGQAALAQGATTLPFPLPALMRSVARVMTSTAYWL